jgi:Spy/CpxP family protein refolding chaperone
MKLTILKTALLVSALGGFSLAQPSPEGWPPAPPNAPFPPVHGTLAAPRGPQPGHGPEHGMMMPGPAGKWWNNPELAKQLNLTADQQKKMDEVFQQHRMKMIDLHAALEREEATLDPLLEAANPDDAKVLPQIDRVAQARAELEKANARLLLGLRHVLTPEQWKKLDSERPGGRGPEGHGGPGGLPGGQPGRSHPPQRPGQE